MITLANEIDEISPLYDSEGEDDSVNSQESSESSGEDNDDIDLNNLPEHLRRITVTNIMPSADYAAVNPHMRKQRTVIPRASVTFSDGAQSPGVKEEVETQDSFSITSDHVAFRLRKRNCRISHTSQFKVKFDLFVMLFAIWNSFEIPINIAFEPEAMSHWMFRIIEHFIDLVFFMDIVINFRTTYVNQKTNKTVYEWKLICWNYLKGRFMIDFLAAIPFEMVGGFFIPEEN